MAGVDCPSPAAQSVLEGSRCQSNTTSELSGRFLGLPKPWPLGLRHDFVELVRTDGLDEGRDDRRQLVFGRDGHSRLALLELHGTPAGADRHEQVTCRVGPPPGPDLLLLCDDPLLAALFDRPLDGPDEVRVIQKGLLLFKAGNQLCPPDIRAQKRAFKDCRLEL